jgi:3-methyladenine DNA glycosylase AlkD
MTVDEVLAELESLGSAQTVKTFRRHGAEGPMFGVKVGDLKKVLKKIKGDQQLAMELWDTNNSDAMYLAGLLADGAKMTRKQLDAWAKSAWWYMLSEYAVPFVAAEHPQATDLAMKWIKSRQPSVAASGWATYALALGVCDDEQLDLDEIRGLMRLVEQRIDAAPDRVRYCMNNFVISVGTYVPALLEEAKQTAERLGKVAVDMGETSCKVPVASDVIAKIESMGRVGRKRKTAKC